MDLFVIIGVWVLIAVVISLCSYFCQRIGKKRTTGSTTPQNANANTNGDTPSVVQHTQSPDSPDVYRTMENPRRIRTATKRIILASETKTQRHIRPPVPLVCRKICLRPMMKSWPNRRRQRRRQHQSRIDHLSIVNRQLTVK